MLIQHGGGTLPLRARLQVRASGNGPQAVAATVILGLLTAGKPVRRLKGVGAQQEAVVQAWNALVELVKCDIS